MPPTYEQRRGGGGTQDSATGHACRRFKVFPINARKDQDELEVDDKKPTDTRFPDGDPTASDRVIHDEILMLVIGKGWMPNVQWQLRCQTAQNISHFWKLAVP